MIDYEKLKKAHIEANKLPFESFSFDLWHRRKGSLYVLTFEDNENLSHEYESENIDDIIKIIHEFTKPKPKYEVGQEVWASKLSIFSFHIISVSGTKYYDGDDWYDEEELYPSKSKLIEAHLQYWSRLKLEEGLKGLKASSESEYCAHSGVKLENKGFGYDGYKLLADCQHESDGQVYIQQYADMSARTEYFKCKKCGEFYK